MALSRILLIALCAMLLSSFAQANAALLDKKKLAVIAVSSSPDYKRYEKSVRTAFESILNDNGIQVLDLDKANELRNNWDRLNDPSAFVTAEDFIERSQGYEIDGIVTLYFDVEVREVMTGYYSAAVNITSRVVSSEAEVRGKVTVPMGSLGNAPSDGLTASAAVVNALHRETDQVALAHELELLAPARPRFLDMELVQSSLPADARELALPGPVDEQTQAAVLAHGKKRGVRRTVSCSRLATDKVGVLGIYIRDMDLQQGPSYGSSLAVVDIDEQRSVNELVAHQVNRSAARNGSAELEDCLFFNGWRFVIGVADRGLRMFDVEKGRLVAAMDLPKKLKSARLSLHESGGKVYLRARSGSSEFVVQLRAKK